MLSVVYCDVGTVLWLTCSRGSMLEDPPGALALVSKMLTLQLLVRNLLTLRQLDTLI